MKISWTHSLALCVVIGAQIALASAPSPALTPGTQVEFRDSEVPYFEVTSAQQLVLREPGKTLSQSGTSVLDSLGIPDLGSPREGDLE